WDVMAMLSSLNTATPIRRSIHSLDVRGANGDVPVRPVASTTKGVRPLTVYLSETITKSHHPNLRPAPLTRPFGNSVAPDAPAGSNSIRANARRATRQPRPYGLTRVGRMWTVGDPHTEPIPVYGRPQGTLLSVGRPTRPKIDRTTGAMVSPMRNRVKSLASTTATRTPC